MEEKSSSNLRDPKDCYDSVLLQSVVQCRPQQLKEYHETLSTTLITDKDDAQILEEISIWENKVNFNDVFREYISSMWELPEIGNFLAILFKELDLDIINQGEIERMFLMPKESTTLAKIMTTLLMPVKKIKCIDQVMSYKVWSEKLSKKVSDWCKVYHTNKQNKVVVMDLLGIHPDFWLVVNEKNPLIEKDYSELSYFIKVWLVKGLCDYITIKFKTINDIITNCKERQCTIWKNDLETEEYFFFNSMPDLRIYYYNIPYDEPRLEFLESVKTIKPALQFEDNLTLNRFSKDFHTIPKENIFKLIANSVEGLRSFVCELNLKRTSVPETLISSLENLIAKVELKENNYIAINNDSKIKLFNDWVSYPSRIQKDKDNMSHSEKKNSNAIAQAKNEELIIVEKRKRNLKVNQNVSIVDSGEYDDESFTDFTDSEDEWGAINRFKHKVKRPRQTPSKAFLELEKRALEAEKMLKDGTNQSDEKQLKDEVRSSKHSINKVSKSNKKNKSNKSVKSVKLLKTQNEVEIDDTTNTIVNSHNQVNKLQHTPSKCIKLEKQLKEENTTLILGSNKMFKVNKIDKSMRSVKLTKTQNELKCSNNTNSFVNINKKRLVHTQNKDNACIYEEIELTDSNTEEKQKPPGGLKQVEVINLDEAMQNDCEGLDDNFEPLISTRTKNKNRKTYEQNNQYIKRLKFPVNSIKDDDPIIIIDDTNDVQHSSMTRKPVCSLLKTNKPLSLKTNSNKSYNFVSPNRQITPTNYIKDQETSSIIHRLSQNITILPANVNIPKDNAVTRVKTSQIDSNLNSVKFKSTISNGHLQKKPSATNVKCELISKPNLNGEVKLKQKSPGGLKQVKVINLDEAMQNDCGSLDDNFEPLISTHTKNKNRKTNEQNNKYIKRLKFPVNSIKDDDPIIIIDDTNDVQHSSMTRKPVCSLLKTNKPLSLKTNSNKSYNFVSPNRQITPTNYIKDQETSSIIHRLSQNITILPANVNIPKDNVVTRVKTSQIDSNMNSVKFKSTISNDHLQKKPSATYVKCELISKPNSNGEVMFYVRLPNGTKRSISNKIINQYLTQNNNQLPDFWLVPLAVEDFKQ